MNTVRKYSAMLTIVAAMALVGCNGCGTLDPGADPVVVRAEQTAAIAFDVFDTYVHMEFNNRAALRQVSPKFEEVANIVRSDGLTSIEELRIATNIYKSNRSEDNKRNMQTLLTFLENLQRVVNQYIISPKTAGVQLPANTPTRSSAGLPPRGPASGTNR